MNKAKTLSRWGMDNLSTYPQNPSVQKNNRAIRSRNVQMFRCILQGQPIDEVAEQYKVTISILRSANSEMTRLLYFRTSDRKGAKNYPNRYIGLMREAAFWLDQLNNNEDKLLVLDADWLKGIRSYDKE